MKIAAISDIHGKMNKWYKALNSKSKKDFNSVDCIVVAGDMTMMGRRKELAEFLDWLDARPVKHKVVIAGNHDRFMDPDHPKEVSCEEDINDLISRYPSIHYLNDSGITIDNISFWGSPIQPAFGGWAFNRERGEDINQHWHKIPAKVDVLITHGPPFGILDQIIPLHWEEHIGCRNLLDAVVEVKPKFHVFGHIHGSFGKVDLGNTVFCNVSSLGEDYSTCNPPQFFEV